jgi:hypothetical protein
MLVFFSGCYVVRRSAAEKMEWKETATVKGPFSMNNQGVLLAFDLY